MRQILISIILFTAALPALSRNCTTNSRGEIDWQTQCKVEISGKLLKRCRVEQVPGSQPGTIAFAPVIKSFGWSQTSFGESKCDITLEQCQALAQQQLETSSYTDECGQTSVGKKAKYKFQVLDIQELKFKTTHQGELRK